MNNQKKPVILIVDNSISFTGAFKCALTEATLLRNQYTFIFVVPDGSRVVPVLQQSGFVYYELPFTEVGKSFQKLMIYGPRLLQNAIRLKSILKKEKVELLQVNDFYNLLGVAVKLLGYKAKLITYVRLLPHAVPAPLRKLWIRLAHRYADAVVAVSDAVLYQLPHSVKNMRIYDAVVLTEKQPAKNSTSDHFLHFLYLGNYIRGKGQDYAIRAFRKVLSEQSNVKLTFVGGDMGLQKNKVFKRELEHFATEHNLTHAVTFKPFANDIEKEIKEADVVLNFSEGESFSMTCAEASYYGVPVIATRSGGPQEIIVHQKTGLLVDNKNVEAMYEAMLTLARNPQLRQRYGIAASAYVKETFSKDAFIKCFETLLKRIGV
jgi:glycosyltransferase involved in cell wall biosynthesis